MKLLKCKICKCEADIIESDSINKKIKCTNFRCSFFGQRIELKEPEVFIIRKRNASK